MCMPEAALEAQNMLGGANLSSMQGKGRNRGACNACARTWLRSMPRPSLLEGEREGGEV